MSTTPENPLPLDTIAAALRIAAIGGDELWGYDEIAAWSKHERNYVVNVITQQEDFPKPVRVSPSTKGHPRYFASDVIAWGRRRQQRS